MQAGTRFTYPGEIEGWVDLVDLIVPRPGVEPSPFDHESDAQPLHHQDNQYLRNRAHFMHSLSDT